MINKYKKWRDKIVQKGRTEMDKQIKEGKYDKELEWLKELDRKYIELKKLVEG